jgi:hypothetical protein
MLIKLERELSTVANLVHGKNLRFAKLTRLARQKLATIAAFCQACWMAFASWIRKMGYVAIHGSPLSIKTTNNWPVAAAGRKALPKRRVFGHLEKVAVILVYVCLGLVIVCGIVAVLLLVQIRELKTEMAFIGYEFAATKAKVSKLEKVAREIDDGQSEAAPHRKTADAQLEPPSLVLGGADIEIIRQFIKVPPPQLGAQAKLNAGDNIAQLTVSPIPKGLADALPKLRDAVFSIDQNSSIIIIGAGSKRIDAVVAYR